MLPAVVLMSSTLLCIRVYVGRFDEDVSPPGAAGVSPFDSFSFDCLMVDGAEILDIAKSNNPIYESNTLSKIDM